MKKMIAMMILTAVFAATAFGGNWTGLEGGVLEHEKNWENTGGGWPAEWATFSIATNSVLTTVAGFASDYTTLTASGCAVTFAIPSPREYVASTFVFNTANPPAGAYSYIFQGGGTLRSTGEINFNGSDNRMRVAGSRFQFGNGLNVGNSGSALDNHLVLDGTLSGDNVGVVRVGTGNSAHSNSMTVMGSAAFTNNAGANADAILVGTSYGSNNRFVVSNATVNAGGGNIRISSNNAYSGTNNVVLVTDGGILECNTLRLQGGMDSGNMLRVGTNSFFYYTSPGSGFEFGNSGGSGTRFEVAGGTATFGENFWMGGYTAPQGGDNVMEISEGGSVAVGRRTLSMGSGSGNRISIFGDESRLTVGGIGIGTGGGSSNRLEVLDGGTLDVNDLNLGSGEGNRGMVSNATILINNGLSVSGISSTMEILGGASVDVPGNVSVNGTGSQMIVSGADTLFRYGSSLQIGTSASSTGNLLVFDGVESTDNVGNVNIGTSSGTDGNVVIFCGGAVFSNTMVNGNAAAINFGTAGNFNRFVVSNATVNTGGPSRNFFQVGSAGSANGKSNLVLVTAGGTLATEAIMLHGGANNGNRLRVEADSTFHYRSTGTGFDLGCTGGSGNRFEVAGGTATFGENFCVGGWSGSGSANVMEVSEGGTVELTGGNTFVLGAAAGGDDNRISIFSGGTVTSTRMGLTVGSQGARSRLEVYDGGTLNIASTIYVGGSANATDCVMAVENAAVNVGGGLWLGNAARLELRGTTTDVTMRDNLSLNDVTVRFGFDRAPPEGPMLESTNGTLSATAPVTLEIDAEKLKDGGKEIVLMRFASAPSSTTWDTVTNKVSVLSGAAKVYVGNGGRDLLCDVAGSNGTLILVR